MSKESRPSDGGPGYVNYRNETYFSREGVEIKVWLSDNSIVDRDITVHFKVVNLSTKATC